MSQHHFYTKHLGKKTHVLMGWDRPLQGFFMVINKEDDEPDQPFWSNLDHDNSHPETLAPFLNILKSFGISLPSNMIDAIKQDGFANIGNKQVVHIFKNGHYKTINTNPCEDGLAKSFSEYAG